LPKLNCVMRSSLTFATVFIWLGIWLTGFELVHWLLYLLALVVTFAAVSGLCVGGIFFGRVCKKTASTDFQKNVSV
jgi:hypothetical protein